jgi:hypothetical protein
MIVSDSHRFIFLHNPKCGGTSIRHVLSKYDSFNNSFWRKTDERLPRHDLAHMEAAYIKDFFPEIWEKTSTYFVFGFTREPLSRFLSGFNETHKKHYSRLCLDSSYIEDYRRIISSYACNLLSKPHGMAPYAHTFPQYKLFYYHDKRISDLEIKIDDTQNRSSLVALEHFLEMEVVLDLKKALATNTKKNKKPSPLPLESLIDHELLGRLRDYYRLDYYLFNYSCRA